MNHPLMGQGLEELPTRRLLRNRFFMLPRRTSATDLQVEVWVQHAMAHVRNGLLGSLANDANAIESF